MTEGGEHSNPFSHLIQRGGWCDPQDVYKRSICKVIMNWEGWRVRRPVSKMVSVLILFLFSCQAFNWTFMGATRGLPQELECFWLQEPVPERSEEERRQAGRRSADSPNCGMNLVQRHAALHQSKRLLCVYIYIYTYTHCICNQFISFLYRYCLLKGRANLHCNVETEPDLRSGQEKQLKVWEKRGRSVMPVSGSSCIVQPMFSQTCGWAGISRGRLALPAMARFVKSGTMSCQWRPDAENGGFFRSPLVVFIKRPGRYRSPPT